MVPICISGKVLDLRALLPCHATLMSSCRGYDCAFAVNHYAGEVTYDVEGFCDKNKDTLFTDLIETVQCSQVSIFDLVR